MNSPMASPSIDLQSLYRLPWSLSDNAFSWLEVTRACDLDCPYCYQVHDPRSHKPLEQFEEELDGLVRLRKSDAVVIAGGEPLTHPRIVDMVRAVAARGLKPVLLTNGCRLTPELLCELKLAGLSGVVFHVDSGQNRPGWEGKSESEHNVLRQELADLVHDVGGLFCGFNATILPETIEEVPAIVRWLAANVHKVHAALLIPVRVPDRDDPYEYFAGATKVELDHMPFTRPRSCRKLTAQDVHEQVLDALPNFRFHSYLAGTLRSDVPKWLFGTHIGTPELSLGNVGPRTMELSQTANHMAKKRYLAFLGPRLARSARLFLALAPFDRELRKTLWAGLKRVFTNPLRLFRRLHAQTLIVMQPQDVLPNGEQDVCDGCPNKTYWQGRLVSECRMEEHLRYGRLLTIAPKSTTGPSATAPRTSQSSPFLVLN